MFRLNNKIDSFIIRTQPVELKARGYIITISLSENTDYTL